MNTEMLIYELWRAILTLKSWLMNWERNSKIEKLMYELRRAILTLKSWLMNWEEQYEQWKVNWWIEKCYINIEKLIDELRRTKWALKS
jgi:hypothetical protein